ncbi:hypothetical protein [Actinomadura rugatobispora]|uniref:Mce-associated membrane protein n=1 Tax=Actinomadura rugatobispora TaxID=1994 RepID=A0ABW1AA40_9ACTN
MPAKTETKEPAEVEDLDGEGREDAQSKSKKEDQADEPEGKDRDGEQPKADDDAPGDRGGRRARLPGRATLTRAVFALVLLASVVTAGLQWHQADQAATVEGDRRDVRARAGEFGQALLSYDHRNLQAARNRVLSLASEDFAKTYDVAFTGGLESVITRLKADATATVRSVYLGDIDDSTARAIVVMDSEVRSSAGTRRVLGSHLDMRLVRKGERWRVTEVTSVGAADESMTDPNGKKQGDGTPLPTPAPSSGG